MSLTQKLFSFDGRLRRRDWWLLGIALGVVSVLVQWAIGTAMGVNVFNPAANTVEGASRTAGIVGLAVGLAFLWPSAALSIKRGHDRNRPAWIIILFYVLVFAMQGSGLLFAPAAGATPAELSPGLMITGLLGLLVAVFGIYILIDYGFLDGTAGPNKYGPSPKALAGSAEAFE